MCGSRPSIAQWRAGPLLGRERIGQLGNGGEGLAVIATAVLGASYSTLQRPHFENLNDIRTHEFDWHSMPEGAP